MTTSRADHLVVPDKVEGLCGWCTHSAVLERTGPPVEHERRDLPRGERLITATAAYVCPGPRCGRQSLLFFEIETHSSYEPTVELVGRLPRGTARPIDGLPEAIADVREEAWSCFYGRDFRAAVVMARAAVQRAVRTLDAEGVDLYHEIVDLFEKRKVTEDLRDWAHSVRLSARDAAHPDELGEVTQAQAADSLDFADSFLTFAVALPARRKPDTERP